ncbi:hypothetical protein SUDANB15_00160 [Streptomyces sp. enrichment culture]
MQSTAGTREHPVPVSNASCLPDRSRSTVRLHGRRGTAPTQHGAQIASEWPELRGRRPPRSAVDRTAVRLEVGHGLTVTGTALAFLQDARRRSDVCRPLDWIPEVHHPLGGCEAVVPRRPAPLPTPPRGPYGRCEPHERHGRRQRGRERCQGWGDAAGVHRSRPRHHGPRTPRHQTQQLRTPPQLHARTRGPAAATTLPRTDPRKPATALPPLPPRLLFILDGTGPTGVEVRIHALRAAARDSAPAGFLRDVPVLTAPMTDLLRHGPTAPVWRPIQEPDHRTGWMHTRHP